MPGKFNGVTANAGEHDPSAVKQQARCALRRRKRLPVDRVSDNRMPDPGHVHSELVRSPGHGLQRNQGSSDSTAQASHSGHARQAFTAIDPPT